MPRCGTLEPLMETILFTCKLSNQSRKSSISIRYRPSSRHSRLRHFTSFSLSPSVIGHKQKNFWTKCNQLTTRKSRLSPFLDWPRKVITHERSWLTLFLTEASSFFGAFRTIEHSCWIIYWGRTWFSSGDLHSLRLLPGPASIKEIIKNSCKILGCRY